MFKRVCNEVENAQQSYEGKNKLSNTGKIHKQYQLYNDYSRNIYETNAVRFCVRH